MLIMLLSKIVFYFKKNLEPNLYIGIDKPLNKEWIDLFVPHEMFHMVRQHMTQDSAPRNSIFKNH